MLPVSTAPEARRRTHAGPEDAGAEAAHDETAQALLTAWPPLDKAQARPQARPAPPRAADREQPPVISLAAGTVCAGGLEGMRTRPEHCGRAGAPAGMTPLNAARARVKSSL